MNWLYSSLVKGAVRKKKTQINSHCATKPTKWKHEAYNITVLYTL